MRNRLEIAQELMETNGVLFVHIDDREMHYLKLVADEIFGRDNFIATVPRKTRNLEKVMCPIKCHGISIGY